MVLDKAEPENTGYIIDTENVWRTYRAGTHQEVHALRGITLQIQPGKFVTIKGRSGSGKTTLLNCIGGLDRPTQGIIRVFGQDLSVLSERQLVQFRRQQVGFIFQSFGLTPTFSAYENVELMLRIAGVASRQRKGRTQECLELVGLKKWGNHRPDELSGGQQQRVAIARALANHPKLILADEPTGDLDSGTAREILSIFRRIVHHEHVTMLVSSHDPLVAAYADEVLELSDGQLIARAGATVAI